MFSKSNLRAWQCVFVDLCQIWAILTRPQSYMLEYQPASSFNDLEFYSINPKIRTPNSDTRAVLRKKPPSHQKFSLCHLFLAPVIIFGPIVTALSPLPVYQISFDDNFEILFRILKFQTIKLNADGQKMTELSFRGNFQSVRGFLFNRQPK